MHVITRSVNGSLYTKLTFAHTHTHTHIGSLIVGYIHVNGVIVSIMTWFWGASSQSQSRENEVEGGEKEVESENEVRIEGSAQEEGEGLLDDDIPEPDDPTVPLSASTNRLILGRNGKPLGQVKERTKKSYTAQLSYYLV